MVSQKMNGGRIYLLVRFSLLCGGDRCCGIAQVGRPAAARCWQFSAVVVKIHGARNVACPPTVLSQNYVPVRTFRNERRENLSSDIRNWSVLRLRLVIPWPPTTHNTNIDIFAPKLWVEVVPVVLRTGTYEMPLTHTAWADKKKDATLFFRTTSHNR